MMVIVSVLLLLLLGGNDGCNGGGVHMMALSNPDSVILIHGYIIRLA
jgi:hypothetical protein